MAKAVADVDSGSNQGGFTTEGGNVTGFSTMHDSGTGMYKVPLSDRIKNTYPAQVVVPR